MPSSKIELDQFKVNGHTVSFSGDLLMAFRLDDDDDLLAFDGRNCKKVVIDGKRFEFASQNLDHIAWTPVVAGRQVSGGAFFQIYLEGEGEVSIPMKTDRKKLKMFSESPVQGIAGKEIPLKYQKGKINLKLDESNTGKWLYITGE